MNFEAILGALIAAAIIAAVVFGLEKYVFPPIENYLPDKATKYKYIILGLAIVILAGIFKLGGFGKYILDAGQVIMVLGFVDVYNGLMQAQG